MEASIFIGKLLAVLYLVVGVGIFLSPAFYRKVMANMVSTPALLYLGGLMALLAGSLIVMFHNVWRLEWTLLITLIGWLALAKGILFMTLPDLMLGQFQALAENDRILPRWGGGAALLLGALLAFFSFGA